MNRAAAAKFWSWFEKREDELFRCFLSAEQSAAALQTLNAAVGTVDDSLTFELGAVRDGQRDLVLTANGVRESMPVVAQLLKERPALDRFSIIALRQRLPLETFTAVAGEKRLAPAEVQIAFFENRRLFDLTFYVPGYDKQDHYLWLDLCYSLLDAAIGEADVAVKINEVSVTDLADADTQSALPFLQFPEKLDEATHYLVTALEKHTEETRRETLLHRNIGLLPQRIDALRAEGISEADQISAEFYFVTPSSSTAETLSEELEESFDCVVFADTANSVLGEVQCVTCYVDVPAAKAQSLHDLVVNMAEKAAAARATLEDVSLSRSVPTCLGLLAQP